jgi:hypothetical protein
MRQSRELGILIGMEHALGKTLAVAKIDEDHTTVVTG